jgi:transposase
MMGPRQKRRPKLFYSEFDLEERIPLDHIFRTLLTVVDFDFIRPVVKASYGKNGNVSIDPVVVLKLMFLLFYEKVSSERALMSRLPMRLDWLWFCGYDIDDELPDHSVLSKARRRWGKEIFAEFFERILLQCMEAGLVDGTIVHVDSSMIDGNASKDKLKVYLRSIGGQVYETLDHAEGTVGEVAAESEACKASRVLEETKPEEESQLSGESRKSQESSVLSESNASVAEGKSNLSADMGPLESVESPKPGQKITRVDPDARVGKKYGRSTLGYKDHRVVDDRCGIITATVTTPANVNDDRMLGASLDAHEENTSRVVETVVADKIYGTGANYKDLRDRGVDPCIPHKQKNCNCDPNFANDRFVYDAEKDEYVCPAGERLLRRQVASDKNAVIYKIPREVCAGCVHFEKCVSSKTTGRQVSRNFNQDHIDWADKCLSRTMRKRLMSRRKAKIEGSFADAANNHGFKRARWRGLIPMSIQNLMIAAAQNLRKLLRTLGDHHGKSASGAVSDTAGTSFCSYAFCIQSFFSQLLKCHDGSSPCTSVW